MNELKILISVLAVVLIFMPGVVAIEGENPAETFDRLSNEGLLIIISVSGFFLIMGVAMIIFGGASPKIRAWGGYIIMCVLLGNFVLIAAPWVLELIRPGST